MFKISLLIAAVAGLLTLPWPALAKDEGPKEAKTTSEIVKAIEKIHLGLALGTKPDEVRTAEFSRGDIKVFVAWHSPFFGVKSCCAHLYAFSGEKKIWTSEISEVFNDTNEVWVEYGDKVTIRDERREIDYKYSLWAESVDPITIKAKVSIKPDDEFAVEFNRDGDQLTNPSKSKKDEVKKLSVKVKLGATSASPIAPPREGATRPFLSVENNFEKTLHFRALVRMKGNKEFLDLTEDMKPIPAGETFNKCWGFDSPVEEVVLYEFRLSDQPA